VWGVVQKIYNHDSLEEGTLVHLYGYPSLHEKSGNFSIAAQRIIPTGEGALKIAFDKLKEKLEQEGLFRPERKRFIPEFPQHIGLITAKGSEAYKDFIKITSQRMGGLKIHFYPVTVQGRGSVESIVNAVSYFNENMPFLDVLVVCRGGGSLEDLQSFNDEKVVHALFSSKAPVVTGIGHEGDVTLADLVADLRASTPSNAAELIVRDREDVFREIEYSKEIIEKEVKTLLEVSDQIKRIPERLEDSMSGLLGKNKGEMYLYVTRMKGTIDRQVSLLQRTIDNFRRLFDKYENKLSRYREQTSTLAKGLTREIYSFLIEQKTNLQHLEKLLVSLSYETQFKRGFSITLSEKGKIIRKIEDILKGDRITTVVENGNISSTVVLIDKK
jgi:exodeoxyribonuclease VII large subunit